MSDRRSGFGPGWSKEADSIAGLYQLGLIYQDEARDNLRLSGMELRRKAEMPLLSAPPSEPDYEAYAEDDDDEYQDFADDPEVTDE